jgi:Fe-S-cluster-containing dehydrogenase component
MQDLTRIPKYEASYSGAKKISWNDPMVVKSQSPVNDGTPYVRYSCWHCEGAPCATACPLGAMGVDDATGAVYVNRDECDPNNPLCMRQCRTYCRRGGYPKVREQSECVGEEAPTMYKCMLCYKDEMKVPGPGGIKIPQCVATCPAGALTYGERDAIIAKSRTYKYRAGDGHIFWASNRSFSAPASDPFVEDHISPMAGKLSSGGAAKALAVPSLLVGGLYALYRRRLEVGSENE